jgi:hypothetical protein
VSHGALLHRGFLIFEQIGLKFQIMYPIKNGRLSSSGKKAKETNFLDFWFAAESEQPKKSEAYCLKNGCNTLTQSICE